MTASPAVHDPGSAFDGLFKGLADPTRIRIVNLLAAGELCVCDLVGLLDLPQPMVSRHLAYLRHAGLVTVRREPRYAYYRLAPAEDPVHASLVHCVRRCFDEAGPLHAERRAALRRVRQRRAQPCD